MNSSVNDSTLNLLNNLSISLMSDQKAAFILWVIFGALNAVAASLTIAIIIAWKPLHTDTQILAANLAFAEMLGGISLAATGAYHLVNIASGLPETTTAKSCYMKVGIHYFTIDVSAVFHLVLSFDRFMAAVFPLRYNNRSNNYSVTVSIVFWLVPSLIFVCSFFDLSSETYIPVCLVRAAVGTNFYSIYIYTLFTVSTISVLLYCVTVAILKCQILNLVSKNSSVAEIKTRMRNKATKALGLGAILHFITFTASAFGSVLIANLLYHGTIYGPYLGVMYFTGGITSFVFYIICHKQFYIGLLHLFGKMNVVLKKTTNSIRSSNQVFTLQLQHVSHANKILERR